MARITKAEQALIPNVGLFVSGDVLQRLTQDELSDRVHYARQLMTKAAATRDPDIKKGYNRLAGAVLQAPRTREETEHQAEDLLTKAALTPAAPIAEQLRAQALRFLEANPVAPRRQQAVRQALRKAADEGQVAVYDKDGNLVGTCNPAKITRLVQVKAPDAPADAQAPQEPAAAPAPAPVAKAQANARRTIAVLTRPL